MEQNIGNNNKYEINKQNLIDSQAGMMAEMSADGKDHRTSHQIDKKLPSIRIAMMQYKSEYYDKIEKQLENLENKEIDLEHSQGTKYAKDGAFVIDFKCAGSTYVTWRADYAGIKGRSYDALTSEYKDKLKNGSITKEEKEYFSKELYEKREEPLRDKKYGNKLKNFKNVRSKINDNGTKRNFTMAGPNLANSKVINNGSGEKKELEDRTIGTIENEIVRIGLEQIKNIYLNWEYIKDKTGEIRNIYLMFQGHSRGAVAVLRGSAKLNYELYEQYGKKGGDLATFYDVIFYQLELFEPVPGFKDQSGVNMNIDLLHNKKWFERYGLPEKGYRPLSEKAECIVFLSLYQNYEKLFDPCRVLNSQRVVLTLTDHTINLDKIDYSQSGKDGKTHKMPYFYYDESKNKVTAYRGSGLNQLPEGVFLSDERGVLFKIENMEEYKEIITNGILKDTHGNQTWGWDGRANVVKDVVESCLEREAKIKEDKAMNDASEFIFGNNNEIKINDEVENGRMAIGHINIINANNLSNDIGKNQINKDGNAK